MSDAATIQPRGYIARAGRHDWRTPPEVLSIVRDAFGGEIALDPCASDDPAHHFATHNIVAAANGLQREWMHSPAFVNPPFDGLAEWAQKCAAFGSAGGEVILLLPSRTDTRYWHEHVESATVIAFWKGRLRFVGAEASCPFPTALAYWGPCLDRFTLAVMSHASVHRTVAVAA